VVGCGLSPSPAAGCGLPGNDGEHIMPGRIIRTIPKRVQKALTLLREMTNRQQAIFFQLLCRDESQWLSRLFRSTQFSGAFFAQQLQENQREFQRKRAPGNPKRDDEIIRLRDEKKLSFGQIGGQKGMSRQAAAGAYRRRKDYLALRAELPGRISQQLADELPDAFDFLHARAEGSRNGKPQARGGSAA
jgi:hypothetical protein